MNAINKYFVVGVSLLMIHCSTNLWAIDNVLEKGLKGDGKTDETAALQKILDTSPGNIYIPEGSFLLGPVKIPANTTITFSPKAKIVPNEEKVKLQEVVANKGFTRKTVKRKEPLFAITGDNVTITGLNMTMPPSAKKATETPVSILIHAENVKNIKVSSCSVKGFTFEGQRKGKKIEKHSEFTLFSAKDCQGLELKDSCGENMSHMINTLQCSNVSVHGNRMINGGTITTFAFGSENLRHHDNWSRQVVYQCVWRGGSPDPSRKAPKVPLGTAHLVKRGSKPEDKNFIPHTQGVFDVLIQNNYAEYGTVLCWGNKSRQVVIDGNISRFMWDYAYGVEACENTVFSNNISINSAVAGFMSMYWGERVVVTGNMIIVRHEPFRQEFTPRPESTYYGQFVRLHHGPPNKEDKYGAGSVIISGNLFVNELENRPSGISIEGGRDAMISGNKIINGMIRKHDELTTLKLNPTAQDTDEFASQEIITKDGQAYRLERRQTAGQANRVTITGNEFISRQPGDKPTILINGTCALSIIKDNIIRKEASVLKFTDEQKELEKGKPRYMLFATDDADTRELTNSKPDVAIKIAPFSGNQSIIMGNIIMGWKNAINAKNTSAKDKASFIVTGNTVDGAITVEKPNSRTTTKVADNLELPPQ